MEATAGGIKSVESMRSVRKRRLDLRDGRGVARNESRDCREKWKSNSRFSNGSGRREKADAESRRNFREKTPDIRDGRKGSHATLRTSVALETCSSMEREAQLSL